MMSGQLLRNGLLVLACVLCGAAANAQNPEKFERVVPAKPQPGASAAGGVVEEIKRKAERGEAPGGVCTRGNLPSRARSTHQEHQRIIDLWLQSGRQIAYRWTFIGSELCEVLSAPSAVRGTRLSSCRHWTRWICLDNCKRSQGRVWRVDGTTPWVFEDGEQCE